MRATKEISKNKGITLIALVITIIVMLILVGVTISMAVNGGLFDYAEKAVGDTKNVIVNESQGYDKYVQDMLIKYGVEEGTVTNPYEEDGWEYAWACTDGVWSEKINKGEIAEGDVIAKFYKTEKQVPANEEMELPEGDEYHLIIEGQGEMGSLGDLDDEVYNAWFKEISNYMSGSTSEIPIICYVTNLIVCDGVTNIGDLCMMYSVALENVILGKNIITIGDFAFMYCAKLKNINIPTSVTSIGMQAFCVCKALENIIIADSVTFMDESVFAYCFKLSDVKLGKGLTIIPNMTFVGCTSLVSIEIPNNIINIENTAFLNCKNLSKIKFLTMDANKITIGERIFSDGGDGIILPEESKIYVLSEEMKTKLEGTYDSAKTTVEVVTLEEMNQI